LTVGTMIKVSFTRNANCKKNGPQNKPPVHEILIFHFAIFI